jgi:hypothetical protein
MRKVAILILVGKVECVGYMEMKNSEEEMNADYSKTVTAVPRGRFRRADTSSWDKEKKRNCLKQL